MTDSLTSKESCTPPREILAELRWTNNRPELAQIYMRHLAQRAADEIERLQKIVEGASDDLAFLDRVREENQRLQKRLAELESKVRVKDADYQTLRAAYDGRSPPPANALLGAASVRIQHYEAALQKIAAGRESSALIAHDALYQDTPAQPPKDGHAETLRRITQWLEANQPDVFRRGLWDAINGLPATKQPQVQWVSSLEAGCGFVFTLDNEFGPIMSGYRVKMHPVDADGIEAFRRYRLSPTKEDAL